MTTQMISPDSFSYEQILADLKRQLEERYAGTDGAWRDFYAFGAGQIVLELLAGLGAFTTFSAVANRREAYLTQTALASSARAIAGPLGYSAFRGRNTSLRLSIYAHALTTVRQFDKLGVYEDDSGVYDLLALSDHVIAPPSSGDALPYEIEVAIGKLATTRLVMATSKPHVVRFTQENISQHFQLRLNGKTVPHSEEVLDLIEGKYVCLTNAHGSLDVMAMNNYLAAEHQYRAGYELEVLYIDLFEVARPVMTKLTLDIGTVENAAIGSRYQAPDTVEEIQIKAPLKHETGRVVRGRTDYMKMVSDRLPNVVDLNARDLDSATQLIAYIISSEDSLTETELNNLHTELGQGASRPMGVKPPVLVPGVVEKVALTVQVALRDKSLPTASVTDDALRALAQFENRLGISVDLFDLEDALLKGMPYAKAVRVSAPPPPGLTTAELRDWSPLSIGWNQYFEFLPSVSLLADGQAIY